MANPYMPQGMGQGPYPAAWAAPKGFFQWFRPQQERGVDPLAAAQGAPAPAAAGGAGSPSVSGSTIRVGGFNGLEGPGSAQMGENGVIPGDSASGNVSTGLAASEGGRAFGEGSPFGGMKGSGLSTALSLAGMALGVPHLSVPLSIARAAESVMNLAFGPHGTVNQTISPEAQQALTAQRSGERGNFGRGVDVDSPSPTTGPPGAVGQGPPGDPTGVGDTGITSGDTGSAVGQGPPGDPTGVGDTGITSGDTGTGPSSGGSGDSSGGPSDGAPGSPGSDYARGGLVSGPASPPDQVPANLTGGEFVMNPYATQVLAPLLEVLNQSFQNPWTRAMATGERPEARGQDPAAPRARVAQAPIGRMGMDEQLKNAEQGKEVRPGGYFRNPFSSGPKPAPQPKEKAVKDMTDEEYIQKVRKEQGGK